MKKEKFFDEKAWELYDDVDTTCFEIYKCEICGKDFKYKLRNQRLGMSAEKWLSFFKKHPQLGMETDYKLMCHGLCYWQKHFPKN